MRNSIYSVSLDEALLAVGDHHRYQAALIVLSSGFAFSFGCTFSALRLCSETPVAGRNQSHWPCEDTGGTWQFPGLYVVAGVLGLTLLAGFEACIGRRKALTAISVLGLISGFGSVFAPGRVLFQAVLPFKGLADVCGLVISTLYVVETTAAQYRNWFISVIALAVYLASICTQFYWYFNPNYRLIQLISGLFYLFQLFFTMKLIESPRYLGAILGKYSKARNSLLQISIFNHKPAFQDMLEGEKVIGLQEIPEVSPNMNSNSSTKDSPGKLVYLRITKDVISVSQGDILHAKRFNYWDLLQWKAGRCVLFTTIMVWTGVILLNSALNDSEKEEKLQYCLLQWGADCLFLLLTACHINYTGRLGSSIVYLTLAGLGAGLYHLLTVFHCSGSGLCAFLQVGEVVLVHVSRLFAKAEVYVLAVYSLEIVPTVLRFLAISVFLSLSALLWLTSLLFAASLGSTTLPISASLVLFVSLLSCFLPDTTLEELPDYLPEDLEEMQKPTELSQIEVAAPGSPRAHTSQ